jgi:hypothetical protein
MDGTSFQASNEMSGEYFADVLLGRVCKSNFQSGIYRSKWLYA